MMEIGMIIPMEINAIKEKHAGKILRIGYPEKRFVITMTGTIAITTFKVGFSDKKN